MLNFFLKTSLSSVLILSACLFLTSCSKDPDHSIRIVNNYGQRIDGVQIGGASFGGIDARATSDYMPISDGSHLLRFTLGSFQVTSDPIDIQGNGTHKWTISIQSDYSGTVYPFIKLALTEDN